jgi:5-methyltetrahydrofolate corrinoid/iron sulfur protein methyltransferase
MHRSPDGRPFTVIGENIHATRVVRRDGPRHGQAPDGRAALRFEGPDGTERWFALPEAILQSGPYADGKVKHVAAALLAGLGGGPEAYVRWVAARQLDRGADYLDVNVDEVGMDAALQADAMRWVVGILTDFADTPLSLDSSSAATLEVGLDALPPDAPTPLLNSASAERPDVLDLAAARAAAVVLSAAGKGAPPSTAEAKTAAATAIAERAAGLGVPPERWHLDPLVLPVAVDPDAGRAYLEAVTGIRAALGEAPHVTGGLSNVSFGLPVRALLNRVFVDLAVTAGADSGIVDPVGLDIAAALDPDRDAPAYRLAADALTGRDAYCMAYLTAYRSGQLADPGGG